MILWSESEPCSTQMQTDKTILIYVKRSQASKYILSELQKEHQTVRLIVAKAANQGSSSSPIRLLNVVERFLVVGCCNQVVAALLPLRSPRHTTALQCTWLGACRNASQSQSCLNQ